LGERKTNTYEKVLLVHSAYTICDVVWGAGVEGV